MSSNRPYRARNGPRGRSVGQGGHNSGRSQPQAAPATQQPRRGTNNRPARNLRGGRGPRGRVANYRSNPSQARYSWKPKAKGTTSTSASTTTTTPTHAATDATSSRVHEDVNEDNKQSDARAPQSAADASNPQDEDTKSDTKQDNENVQKQVLSIHIRNGTLSKAKCKGWRKQDFRNFIWKYMETNGIAAFPRPVYNRIPNFTNADRTALNFMKLIEFKRARVIKVNPDKPQESIRYVSMKYNKVLLTPTPQLRYGLFNWLNVNKFNEFRTYVDANNDVILDAPDKLLRQLATRYGLTCKYNVSLSYEDLKFGRKLRDLKQIDICVCGSVALDCVTGKRIGKGKGFCDMEIAILTEIGLINEKTLFVSTCHDCQLVDNLTEMCEFDVNDCAMDYIITPTRIIKIDKKKYNKTRPKYFIDWHRLDPQRLNQIPVLKMLYAKKQQRNANRPNNNRSYSSRSRSNYNPNRRW